MLKHLDDAVVYIAGGPDLCASSVSDNGHYWGSLRNRDVIDRTNNFNPEGVVSVFGPGFTEELPSFARANFRSLLKDFSNPLLVGQGRYYTRRSSCGAVS
jgi:hypothetical protein